MTTQSTLGPFMTLILTLTATTKYAAATVTNRPPAGVASSLLLAQLLVELLKRKPAGYASPGGSRLPHRQRAGMSGRFVDFVLTPERLRRGCFESGLARCEP